MDPSTRPLVMHAQIIHMLATVLRQESGRPVPRSKPQLTCFALGPLQCSCHQATIYW